MNKLHIINYTRNTAYGWQVFANGAGSNVYTDFRAYYFDFGILGLCLCQFLFVFLFSEFYKIKEKNDFYMLLYTYYFYILIEQIRAEQFFAIISSTTFAYLILFFVISKIFTDSEGERISEKECMTLREIQLEELEILKKTVRYLDNNNLKYFLCGGTLLGAVRHRGFIPWDDDIDIMMPRIANTYSNGEKDKVKEYMNKSFNLVFLIAFPLIFGLISVSDVFVPVFFGNGYEKTAEIIKIISPIILLIGLSNVTGTQYLLPTKRQNQYTISVVCGSIVNFIMNLILIRKLGAIGASIGTVIAEFTVTSIQIYFTRKDFELKEVLKISKNYVFSAIIMFIVCLILGHMINSNFISVVVQVIVGAITYGVILLLLKDKFIKEFINKILKRS